MFILGIIVNVVNDLPRLKYGHNLAVCHIVSGISNYVNLLMKPPLPIVWVNGYVLFNKPEKSKDYVDLFQICGNKHAGGSNCTIGSISCLESQLILIISLQGMTEEHTEHLQNGFTNLKV